MTVNPCPLTSFTTNGVEQTITYTINDASTSVQYGATTQVPSCEMEEITVVTSVPALPSFITHNEGDKKIDISETSDNSFAGITYEVTVTRTVTARTSAEVPFTT